MTEQNRNRSVWFMDGNESKIEKLKKVFGLSFNKTVNKIITEYETVKEKK